LIHKKDKLEYLYQESYEEALKIVQAKRQCSFKETLKGAKI
jgi:hypothetical protein